MNIYVGNLPYSTTDEELSELFAKYGTVASANIIIDRRNHRSRGYGFVEFADDSEGAAAVQALNDSEFGGRTLKVDEAQKKDEQRPPRRTSGSRHNPPSNNANRRNPNTEKRGLLGFIKGLFS